MNTRRRPRDLAQDRNPSSAASAASAATLRIIGGELRGRQFKYSGDLRTRPMKDNIREAVFNLIGGWVAGKLAIDLFAGSGALGIEALSRGAEHAVLIERHIPTARVIADNLRSLQLEARSTVIASDAFYWGRHLSVDHSPATSDAAWLVFCSPPYDLFVNQARDLMQLLARLIEMAPGESVFVVESDRRFDSAQLPQSEAWRSRTYMPAIIHVLRPAAANS